MTGQPFHLAIEDQPHFRDTLQSAIHEHDDDESDDRIDAAYWSAERKRRREQEKDAKK